MNARVVALVAAAAGALVVAAGSASAFGTVRDLVLGPTAGSRIAFTSFRNGSFDLDVMNADGSKQRRLTKLRWLTPGSRSPAWSPDGRKIAFESARDGNYEIYVVNVDGSGLRRLTRDPASDRTPAWSPDGRRIAFGCDGKEQGIHVINADGPAGSHAARRGTPSLFGLPTDGRSLSRASATVTPRSTS